MQTKEDHQIESEARRVLPSMRIEGELRVIEAGKLGAKPEVYD